MPRKKLPPITDQQWMEAIDAYELGHVSQRQIARELNISAATVSRRFGALGAVKARRLAEFMAHVIVEIDRQRKVRLAKEAAKWDEAVARSQELSSLLDNMMAAILAADQSGNDRLAAGVIARTRAAVAGR